MPDEAEATFAPELVIAFVAPTGISSEEVAAAAKARLSFYRYEVELIRLSAFLEERADLDAETKRLVDKRITRLQTEGNNFRRDAGRGRGDALAFVAVNEIREQRLRRWNEKPDAERPQVEGDETYSDFPLERVAYLVWSLKHPDEVDTLRNVYRSRFVLMSLYASRETRQRYLTAQIAASHAGSRYPDEHETEAKKIIDRDEAEPESPRLPDVAPKIRPRACRPSTPRECLLTVYDPSEGQCSCRFAM